MINLELLRALRLSKLNGESAPVLARYAKLGEEFGELGEALLHQLGYLPHKTMKEPLIGEVADVMICSLYVLAATSNKKPEELLIELEEQMQLKMLKWINIFLETDER
jgi:phosphoribosyl-ATP pyrophosphohydrolase